MSVLGMQTYTKNVWFSNWFVRIDHFVLLFLPGWGEWICRLSPLCMCSFSSQVYPGYSQRARFSGKNNGLYRSGVVDSQILAIQIDNKFFTWTIIYLYNFEPVTLFPGNSHVSSKPSNPPLAKRGNRWTFSRGFQT